MRLTTRNSGIISYAGLDKDALWAAAKRALAQSEDEVPERFASFLPIFPVELIQNMSLVDTRADNRAPVSPEGVSIDPAEYHGRLWEEMPELYVGDNYRRNFSYEGKFTGRGAVTVDNAWATRFPQYQPFIGEKLHIYLIGGGLQAVAVPESIYPRGGEMLRLMERELRVVSRCEHYMGYMKRRISAGDRYDPILFESDYLRINELLPVVIRQNELGHVMQDLCIIRDLKGEQPASRLFTENAKRAEGIAQYAPYRCACDSFSQEPITRSTARLLQLYDEDDVSDLWLPYQDASEYIDKRRMALDVGALCRGFQLAPIHDPAGGGGRYPAHARVVVVRDRELRPLVANTINNPAYGSGMNPLGMMNRLVYLRDSAEMMRQNRVAAENVSLLCENTLVPMPEYRAMVVGATAQEMKGRLIDAMYRRESALSQMQPASRTYERAKALLDEKVDALTRSIERLGVRIAHGQLSGYDADVDYLRRMAQCREEPEGDAEPMVFVPDSLREMSIESGYAMRNGVRHAGLATLAGDGEAEEAITIDSPADEADGDSGEAGKPSQAGDEATETTPLQAVDTNATAENAAEAQPLSDTIIAAKPPIKPAKPAPQSAQFEQINMFGADAPVATAVPPSRALPANQPRQQPRGGHKKKKKR